MPAAPHYIPVGSPVGTPVQALPCGAACCAPTTTECVPEHYVKKTTKVVYAPHGCEPVCLPYSQGWFGCGGCDAGHCDCPYTRRYMIIKIKTCEEDAIKCVPTQVPACGVGH